MTEPPEKGAIAPNWFYVPGVPPTLKGEIRQSYVLWQEVIPPLIAIEFVSGSGTEERAQREYQQAERLAEKLRELGINPEEI